MSLPLPPGRSPRAWQLAALAACREGFRSYRSILVSAATGTGKGTLIPGLAQSAAMKGRRCLVLTNREELVVDLHARCQAVAGARPVGMVMRERDEWSRPVIVASVQSVTPRRFEQLGKVDLVITDECFPGDVPVMLADGTTRRIADVQLGDIVVAVDGDGALQERRVVRLFRSQTPTLVRVATAQGDVVCTPGHPFLTARGWVAGADLTPNDLVRRFDADPPHLPGVPGGEGSHPGEVLPAVPGASAGCAADVHHGPVPGVRCADGGSGWSPAPDGAEGADLLLGRVSVGGDLGARVRRDGSNEPRARLGTDDGPEPDAAARVARADDGDAAPDEAQAADPGRQRPRTDAGGGPALGGARLANERHRADRAVDEGRLGVAEPLQARRREQGSDGGDRGGRTEPRVHKGSGRGPAEGGVLAWARVDRVEVLQRGRDGAAPGGAGDDLVYNLEVEHDHTYVAAGFVVHNCHHATAPSYRRLYAAVQERNPAWKHVGLTATPFRTGKDGGTSGLGDVFEALVFEFGISDAIEAGDLVPVHGYQVRTDLDLSSVQVGADGDYDPNQLADLVDIPARNELVVDQYLERGRGAPALVFAASIAHAQHIAEAFKARGINAEAVWGDMDKGRRRFLISAFRDHPEHLPVLVSRDLLFEGFDAPKTALLIKARPTRSRLIFTQLVGRGLRTVGMPGDLVDPAERRAWIAGSSKPSCTLVDVVENGCDLTLDTLADLSPSEQESDTKIRPLVVGDRVTRRHHEDWGCGWVLAVAGSDVVPLVTVRWPPSSAHAHGTVSVHPRPELRWVPGEAAPDEEPAQVPMPPTITGVRVYPMVGLMGAARMPRLAWFKDGDTLTVGGRVPTGGGVILHVRPGFGGLEVWEVLVGGDTTTATRRESRPTPAAALRWGEEHLRALGVEVSPPDAPWRQELASTGQLGMLRGLGRHRDATGMSAGEASALIDLAVATRAIRQAEDPARFQRAEAVRKAKQQQARERRAGGAA